MNHIETILFNNTDKPGVLFIFPTDVAASRWADRLLRLKGGGTTAMNKFIAWDTFKQDSVRSRKQNRKSIPSALRAIFVSRLIRENAENCTQGRPPVFVSLIRVEWAFEAASFSGWITKLLPQLGSWFSKTTGLGPDCITGEAAAKITETFAGDDRDLYALALRYAQFLDAHDLFEPAWETPPFDDDGKECFIFFPESLSDYSEYRELLESSGRVTPVRVTEADVLTGQQDVFFYANSRSEITEAALYIRALNENKKINWDSIVVSIPDTENYEPYVLREFACRNIPFVSRTGKPLSSYPAGQFFRDAAACAGRDFAFSGLAALVLNRRLPWKDLPSIQKLVDFGIRNNCISSWIEEEEDTEKQINVWEDAFARPFGGIEPQVRRFFEDLRRRVTALRNAASFAELRKQYFAFRERFFDMEKCLPETDLILSRCISELMYLAELERDFPGAAAPDPFGFFVEYLDEVMYLAQQPASGVVILPYRTAAPAPFDCHIILGASHDNLSTVFSRLPFLSRIKRDKLGLADEDASAAFINLHRFNSRNQAAFFCAEQSFSSYAIPHNLLRNSDGQAGSQDSGQDSGLKPRQRYGEIPEYSRKFSPDLYRAESGFYSGGGPFPAALHETQKLGFDAWLSRRKERENGGEGQKGGHILLDLIRNRFSRSPDYPGKINVSATSLAFYFECPLKWLFERVLCLENERIEADLMAENIAGSVYHSVLNLFFTGLKDRGERIAAPLGEDNSLSPALPGAYRELLNRCVNEVFTALPCLPPDNKQMMSTLTAYLLKAEQKHFHFILENCLSSFISYFAGFSVRGTETWYPVERDSFVLGGIVDCILEDTRENSAEKGSSLIVDFKLKKLPARPDCTGEGDNGLVNFQLPMYVSLVEENSKKPVNTALFFSIVSAEPEVLFGVIESRITGGLLPKKEDQRITRETELFQRIMNEFEEKTEQFVHEITSENFPAVKPDNEKCASCSFERVCRTLYKIDREENTGVWGKSNGL